MVALWEDGRLMRMTETHFAAQVGEHETEG